MKRLLLCALLVAPFLLAACGGGKTACRPVEGTVTVCLEGRPLSWNAPTKPHAHEGFFYGPVEEFAAQLGATAAIQADAGKVIINGKQVLAEQGDVKGVHVHDNLVYAPLKQVAEAAGYRVMVEVDRLVVTIRK